MNNSQYVLIQRAWTKVNALYLAKLHHPLSTSSFLLFFPFLVVGPEILQLLQAQNVTDFEGVIVLTCNVSGFPIPSVTWLHNNTEVMEDVPRVNISTVEYNESSADPAQFGRAFSTLSISRPNVNDSGDYACRAAISDIASYAPVTSDNVTVLVQSEK